MMRAACFVIACLALCAAAPARAATGLKYYQDPTYQKINPAEPHPMADLESLAAQGDARAEYILGDLYGKGQGGLGKNRVKARYWFEVSARNGYKMAFIRLAALAKRAKDPVSAYKWYTLGKDAASWRSDEYEWCDSARDAVAQKYKMSAAQIAAAKTAAGDWKDRREDAMRRLEKREAEARAQAAKQEAAEAAENMPVDTDGDVAPAQAKKTDTVTHTNAPQTEEQENSYND